MFYVEYRTISRLGRCYPSRIATVGNHRATSEREAAAHLLRTIQNVEVLNVTHAPIGA